MGILLLLTIMTTRIGRQQEGTGVVEEGTSNLSTDGNAGRL